MTAGSATREIGSGETYGYAGIPTGDSTIIFKVVNGSAEKSYYVNVNRAADDVEPSRNLVIEAFNSKGQAYTLNPPFGPSTHSYAFSIPDSETSVDIRTSINDDNPIETITVNGNTVRNKEKYRVENLKIGDNVITVAIATPSGNKTFYSILVNRADPDTILPYSDRKSVV